MAILKQVRIALNWSFRLLGFERVLSQIERILTWFWFWFVKGLVWDWIPNKSIPRSWFWLRNEDFRWERHERGFFWKFWTKWTLKPFSCDFSLLKDRSLYIKTQSFLQQGSILELNVNIFLLFGMVFSHLFQGLIMPEIFMKNDYTCRIYEEFGFNIDESWCKWYFLNMKRCMLMIFIFIHSFFFSFSVR